MVASGTSGSDARLVSGSHMCSGVLQLCWGRCSRPPIMNMRPTGPEASIVSREAGYPWAVSHGRNDLKRQVSKGELEWREEDIPQTERIYRQNLM